ncbi:MAG: prepilin-type N-terminal cleavage/methylation domain-containing protein [Phycisphaerae bacterium]|nr:prepilin-type N-terminal cleavage/methylation domain-containing protein [Phycisphaerae bacterium]
MQRSARLRQRQTDRGFTLIETALATIIIGVGVLAMVSAQQAFHKKNDWSTQTSIAQRLGNEIREMTLNLPRHDPVTGTENWGPEDNEGELADFDDLDDFDGDEGGGTFYSATMGNGPINARREVIPDMLGWEQTISVMNVDPFDTTNQVADFASKFVKVEVVVRFQGLDDEAPMEMTRVSWIAPK